MPYLMILGAMLFNVIAHLSAKALAEEASLTLRVLLNPYLWLMGIGFSVSVVFWLLALRDLPLSLAHPIFASGILIVQIGSYFVLGEKFDPVRFTLLFIGYAAIALATYLALSE